MTIGFYLGASTGHTLLTMDDADLLREFTANPSGAAFTQRVQQRSRKPPTATDPAVACQQLRDALFLPVPRSGTTWPEARVLEALERFGDRADAAFAALREVLEPSPVASDRPDSLEAFSRDLARS